MDNLESYPPILRHVNHNHHHHHQTPNLDLDDPGNIGSINPAQDPPDPVPVIDLECLGHDIEKLDDACKAWGLFRLVNHGVPLTLLKQLQDQAKELFSMPYESKQASCNGSSPVTYFWGTPALTPSGTAITRGSKNIDWVEGFDVPLARISQFQPQLPSLESMRVLLIEYETHLSRIATTLFKAMMKNLDMNNDIVKKPGTSEYLSEKTGIVRVYRYPPYCSSCSCSDDTNKNNDGNWGMEAHTDSSVLSILNQDDHVSGLQVLTDDDNDEHNHKWLTVKPISNTLIVNLGDMMQAISNDRYKSVSHRVKVNKHRERISICYFVFPNEDFVIESNEYKPFTYNEFRAQVQQDVKALGYKVGLARFKNKNEDS